MWEKYKKITDLYTLDERIVIGLVISIFISIHTTIAVMAVVLIYLIAQNRMKAIFESVPGIHYLLYFCLLAFLVSLSSQNANGVLNAIALALFFCLALYIRSVMTSSLFEKVLDVCCTASIYSFLIMLIQIMTVDRGLFSRTDSTFANANYYASVTELLILFCIYNLIKNKQEPNHRIIFVLLINLTGLYLSNCRTAILALAIAIPVMLILNRSYKAVGIMLGCYAMVAAAVLINPSFLPRLDQTDIDLTGRVSIWRTAIKGILNHPLLGQGGETYKLIFSKYGGPEVAHAHNIILDPILNYGFVGTSLLAMYFKSYFKPLRLMNYSQQSRPQYSLIVAVLVTVLLHGITDISFTSPQTGLLLFVALSIIGVKEHQQNQIPSQLPGVPWPEKKVA